MFLAGTCFYINRLCVDEIEVCNHQNRKIDDSDRLVSFQEFVLYLGEQETKLLKGVSN